MKKLVTILLACLMCGTILAGCGSDKDPEQVLAGYSDSKSYSDGDDDSSTKQEFSKYIYDSSFDSKFENDNNYTKVTSKNKSKIKEYFDNFQIWGGASSFSDNYDFKTDMITDGDYYCIADKDVFTDIAGQRKALKVFKEYSIYYYDTETHVLYYIHNDMSLS